MTFGLLPGADQKQVAVEGVRFALNTAGPKQPPAGATPVLLLHGVPETAAAFRFLLPELAKDRRVLAPDLKGLGDSEVVGPYDVATLVRELAALLLHEIDGPVDVVGHDWGGALALALAGARPDLVRRLVVVNAPYRHLELRRTPYIPFFMLPVLPELAFRVAGRALVRQAFAVAWKAERPLDRVLLTHYERVYTDPERVQAMLAYYRDSFRPRLRTMARGRGAELPPSKVQAEKSLVVWGAADPVLTMRVAESVVRDLGSGATLVSFPGVGHFPLEEAADDVVPVIAEFLRDGTEPLPLPADEPEPAEERAVTLEMPIVPQNKASGRDPDAHRAQARKKVAEVTAEAATKAAARKTAAKKAEPRQAAGRPAPTKKAAAKKPQDGGRGKGSTGSGAAGDAGANGDRP